MCSSDLIATPDGDEHKRIIRELEALSTRIRGALNVEIKDVFTDLSLIRPLHWGLEFPEAFFNDDGTAKQNPGFDAIVGNPPWEKITACSQDKAFLDRAFAEIREGEINFYNLFLYHSHHLTGLGRRTGQIIPNTWLINKYGMLLRRFVLTNFHTEELFYMCKGVFKDAPDTIPVLLQAEKTVAEVNQIGRASCRERV